MPDSGTRRLGTAPASCRTCRLSVAPQSKRGFKPSFLIRPLLQSSNEGSDFGRAGRSGPQTARAGSSGFMNPRTPSSGFRESGDSTAYLDRSIRDLLTEIENTQNQLALLRQENAWLRASLGMESPRGTTIEPAPTNTPPRPASSELASHSQMQEKIGLLRSLFRGRDDVYAVRWTSRTSGKKGYSPAVRGGWSAAKVEPRSYLPLTDKVVEDHVRGIASLGIYPLLPYDTCWFLACAFAAEAWSLDAEAFLRGAKTRDVP